MLKTKNKRAAISFVSIIIMIILTAEVVYLIFLFVSSRDTSGNSVISSETLVINEDTNTLKEKKCVKQAVLVLENMRFFEEPKQFIIERDGRLGEDEICYIRDLEGELYYITIEGDKMFHVVFHNGKRTLDEMIRLDSV